MLFSLCSQDLKLAVSEHLDGINNFLHGNTNSGQLKVMMIIIGWCGWKWVWPFKSWESGIWCI